MQAVILVGGRGKRMMPLTKTTPKPLIKLNDKPLAEHILEEIPPEIGEVILVAGYLGNKIKNYFGKTFNGKKIKYVKQEKSLGTFHALKQAKEVLGDNFLVLMGDDIYSKNDLHQLIVHERAILVRRVDGPSERFGACIVDKGMLRGLYEKQQNIDFHFANCGAYKLTKDIFNEKVVYGKNKEELLSTMAGNLGKKLPVHAIEASFWFPVAIPEDLQKIEKILNSNL